MWRSVASMLVVGMIGLTFTQEASAGRRAWRRQACCYYYTQAPVTMQAAPAAPAAPAYQEVAPPAPPIATAPTAKSPVKQALAVPAPPAPTPVIAQTGGTGTTYRSYSSDSAPAYRAPAQVQNEQYNYGIPAASSVPNLFRGDRKMYGISRMPSYR